MTQEIKNLVRLANTDIMGNKTVLYGLAKIHGVGLGFSGAICEALNLDKQSKIGALDKTAIENIEKTIADPQSKNIPSWMYNRKFDIETGKDRHLIGPKLKLTQEFDLRKMKKIKSYKGIRHMFNLPVRGQKTKGNFRKGKSVGVVKKKK
jgi:small subunit ribosomal protein S13